MHGVDAENELTRRAALVLGCAGLAAARAPGSAPRRLGFEVWRGGRHIGRHLLAFSGDDHDFSVAIDAVMSVKLGPIVIFGYHHQATETWRGGQFAQLHSQTVTNGRREQVSATRTAQGVVIQTAGVSRTLPHDAHPLTHWNPVVLESPLFNPQSGAAMRESVSRQADQAARPAGGGATTRYTLVGDANIVDWYNAQGEWTALRARATDGSYVDYRRAV